MSQENDSSILAFLLGGVIGAGLALLLSPWSGRQTREKILGAAEEAKDKAEDYLNQAKERVTSAVEKGKEVLDKERFNIKAAVDAGKEAYRKEKGKAQGEPE